MLDVLESSIDNSIDYFNVQNLSFDHPLTSSEIEEFKSMIFSINNLSGIYFKGTIDVESIEMVKNLLSISGYVDDRIIEKCVAVMLSRDDIDRLLNSKYENPSTWQVCYNIEDNDYKIADIPKCRSFFSYIDRIKLLVEKEELTPLEIALRVYDIIKLFDYDSNDMSDNDDLLPDVVVSNKASSKGFNKLFSYVLKELGINAFTGKMKSSDGKESYVTIAEIKDDKYAIDGIYLFDPSMDSLSKDTYKSEEIRMINYNYFGLLLQDIENSTYGDTLTGSLGILAIEDFDYSDERRKANKDAEVKKEFRTLEKSFNLSYEDLYNKVKNSQPIPFDTIKDAIDNIYGENKKIPNYDDLVRENYFTRRRELFHPTTNELLDGMLK